MKLLRCAGPMLALTLALSLPGCATRPATVDIDLVALNDFHGHLEAEKFTYTSVATKKPLTVQAGGVDTLAAALQAWRAKDPDLLLVAAGDLVGASPALSSMWADEPSIEAMNRLGLVATAVGNHEFDQGRAELLRQQGGGCASPRPAKACKLEPVFGGAQFPYLAANVLDHASGKPLLPPYKIVQVRGVKIALIGAVLRGTASVALAASVAGLDFVDEAAAVNRLLPELRAHGVTAFVLLIHEGGHTPDYFDQTDCTGLKGPIVDIVGRLDPAIRLVVAGHTHTGFVCRVGERVVTEADMGGHVLTRIRLAVDAATGIVRGVDAHNVVMTAGAWPADQPVSAWLQTVKERSKQALTRPVARLAVPSVSRKGHALGESALGDLITDAELAATRQLGAQIAFMNTGGIRKDLEAGPGGVASYGQAQIVQPFANTLVVMNMSGAQIRGLLEQQWMQEQSGELELLQVSDGFAYSWDPARPVGQRVVPGSMKLNGAPMPDDAMYRVTANNFLAEGGDNFPMFAKASAKQDTSIVDLDALVAYLIARDRAGTPAGSAGPAGRIVRLN